jgi:PAS domain S-box-containing protein
MDLPYEQYFDAMPCYLTVQDRDFRVIKANRRFRNDFGNYEGRYCYQVYKHRSEKCESCPVERTFRDGERQGSEEIVRALDGREVNVIVYTIPIYDEAGEITSVMEMSTDVTELKLLQKKLRQSQERYRLLFEEVPCYISIQDRDLRIIEANRRFREGFGECLGCKCYEMYKHRKEECLVCPVQRTFQDGEVHTGEEVVTSLTGEKINTLVYTAPIHNSKGEIKSVMEMSANITPIRNLKTQLEAIGLLISSISHGIKGQLTGLDGGIYLVKSGMEKGNPKRLRQGWEMVQRNVERIRSMVLNILYYAKERELNFEAVSASDLSKEVLSTVEPKAQEHAIELSSDLDLDAGEFEADVKAFRALLINLAENSIDACRVDKKKSEHRVTLGLRSDNDHVSFEVSDNGIGMDQETREKAFSLFFSSKGAEGTGLGLFIANNIAQKHGASIEVESELGKGTRFVVKVARRHSDEQVESTASGNGEIADG